MCIRDRVWFEGIPVQVLNSAPGYISELLNEACNRNLEKQNELAHLTEEIEKLEAEEESKQFIPHDGHGLFEKLDELKTQRAKLRQKLEVDRDGYIEGSAAAMAFWQDKDGTWQHSLRSIGEHDVAAIAKKWGGGGHKHAAGFRSYMGAAHQQVENLQGCAVCGCTDIQVTAWVYVNGGADVNSEPPTNQIYCPRCEGEAGDGDVHKMEPVDKLDPH